MAEDSDRSTPVMSPEELEKHSYNAQLFGTLAACAVTLSAGTSIGYYRVYYKDVDAHANESPNMTIAEWEISYLTLYATVFLPLGAVLNGLLGSRMGRKQILQLASFFMMVLWFAMSFLTYPWFQIIYLVLGIVTGLIEPCAIMFVGELTDVSRRELMSAAVPVATMFGIFFMEAMSLVLSWHTILYINGFYIVLIFLLLFFVPESPIWLMWTKSEDKADDALRCYRGCLPRDDENIPSHQLNLPPDTGSLRVFYQLRFLKPFVKFLFLFFVVNFSGGTAISGYGPVVMSTAFNPPFELPVCWLAFTWLKLVGSVTFVLASLYFNIKRIGSFSLALASLSLVIVTIYAFGNNYEFASREDHEWAPTVFIAIAVFLSTLGIKLLPWLLVVSAFPMETRTVGVSWLVACSYWFIALENVIFHSWLHSIGAASLFLIYTAINLVGSIGVLFMNVDIIEEQLNDSAEEQQGNGNNIPMQAIG